MSGLIVSILIYLIPFAAIVFFIAGLCNFFEVRKQYNAEPNEENLQKKQAAKTLLVVASVIMGVLVAVIVAFMALMYTAVAYM